MDYESTSTSTSTSSLTLYINRGCMDGVCIAAQMENNMIIVDILINLIIEFNIILKSILIDFIIVG